MWWKRKRKGETEQEAAESGLEEPCSGNGTEIPNLQSNLQRASKRKFSPPTPPDASAKSFVKWMQANGGTGDHLQGDLYDGYRFLMRASNLHPLKRNEFGRELKRAGCGRKEIDISDAGTRSKPYVISIPSGNETEAVEAKEVSRVA